MTAHGMEGLEDAEAALAQDGYDVVRVGYADLIGSERGRDVLVSGFVRTVEDGMKGALIEIGPLTWCLSRPAANSLGEGKSCEVGRWLVGKL